MRSLIAILMVSGLFLVGFALGRSPHTAAPILNVLRTTQKVGEHTANRVESKMRQGLSRLVERDLSDEKFENELSLSNRGIDQTYLKLQKCLQADDPCPGFNMVSHKDYQDDVTRHMVDQLNSHFEYLRARPWDIQSEDERLARVLLDDLDEQVQSIGLKMIGLFPLNETNLNLIAARLSLTTDHQLFREGIDFFYKHKHNRKVVTEAVKVFSRQIHYSPSDSTAATAASAAFDFMNEDNIRSFTELRADMEPFPFRFNAIDSSIREFERQRGSLPR